MLSASIVPAGIETLFFFIAFSTSLTSKSFALSFIGSK